MAYSGKIRNYRVLLIFALIFLFALIGFLDVAEGEAAEVEVLPLHPA